MTEIENLYVNTFSRANPNLGIEVLRAERKERVLTFKNQFLFGFFFGICSCIFITILINRVEFVQFFNPEYFIMIIYIASTSTSRCSEVLGSSSSIFGC
jgi:hypothetical protein